MSNEITASLSVSVTNGNYTRTVTPNNTTFNQNAQGEQSGVLTTSSGAATALPVSLLTTLGWAYLQNLDANNAIDLGITVSATFQQVLKLKPGEWASVRLYPGITFQAKAEAGSPELQYVIWND